MASGSHTVRVEGLRELLKVTDALPKQIKKDVRKELRRVAEPVRDTATLLFLAKVSKSGVHDRGKVVDPKKTRYGISVRKVGTISVEQRVRAKSGNRLKKRPKFTDTVMERSLAPALERNEGEVMDGFNRVLDSLERRWAVG